MLLATRHKRTHPALTPASEGWYSIYLPQRDGGLSWARWLVTYRDGLHARRRSPHPSTNRARRRVTTLIETNALPLSQACHHPSRLPVFRPMYKLTLPYHIWALPPNAENCTDRYAHPHVGLWAYMYSEINIVGARRTRVGHGLYSSMDWIWLDWIGLGWIGLDGSNFLFKKLDRIGLGQKFCPLHCFFPEDGSAFV